MRLLLIVDFAILASLGVYLVALAADSQHLDDRLPIRQRTFISDAVEESIADISSRMKNPILARMFRNCLPNALDTTIFQFDSAEPSTFVITGDIHAMWLRDSTNQMLPYLRFANKDSCLRTMLCGVIQRQSSQVLADPYSNAFNEWESGDGHSDDIRRPPISKIVFEGKYELDSLAAVLKLASRYYQETGDRQCFLHNDKRFLLAVQKILKTVTDEQASTATTISESSYLFQRVTPVATDTLSLQGRGSPAKRCGLSKSYFRPSDDACLLPFLIPSNAMMAVELSHISTLLPDLYPDDDLARDLSQQAMDLSNEIKSAVYEFGLQNNGSTFAYEVDGYGNQIFLDDANIPSLLSLPYLGFVNTTDAIYMATRTRVLSESNPYYFSGSEGSGVGGPHVGLGQIWPMSILIQALTSTNDEEITQCLKTLSKTTAGTYFMHESFDCNNSGIFTRSWFSWANSLFGELILRIAEERPHLIFDATIISQADAAQEYI